VFFDVLTVSSSVEYPVKKFPRTMSRYSSKIKLDDERNSYSIHDIIKARSKVSLHAILTHPQPPRRASPPAETAVAPE
jgi:hypothetical protein